MALRRFFPFALVLALAACAPLPPLDAQRPAAAPDPVAALRLDRATEDRLLAIDPENVTARDVRETLSKVPAPRVELLHGGVFPVHLAMTSFAQFLIGMGYPEAQIRHPADGTWSHSPYERSERLAGMIAWAYERDGMRPMLVGHSQGGMQVVKVLHDLAGTFATELPVWNPLTDDPETRTTIVDPFSRRERPVVGVQASYASAVGAGGPSGVLPNQWGVIGRLKEIPDTVVQFNGYFIGIDWFAMTLTDAGVDRFRSPSGAVQVRNVVLPAGYLHVTIPVTGHLPDNAELKRLVDEYRATSEKPDESRMPGSYTDNFYYAADNWAAIKKHWTLEAQRLVKARRERGL
ncbi:MAG TPA: hypothetical protein VFX05_12140 [Casimicrobiaceae bacterium]|nr:hypothetical protein [Casimicrobiaceae bacterium]